MYIKSAYILWNYVIDLDGDQEKLFAILGLLKYFMLIVLLMSDEKNKFLFTQSNEQFLILADINLHLSMPKHNPLNYLY